MSDVISHIGDGVYVSFDGYQLWLRVNDHRAPPVVALEPQVFLGLIREAGRHFNPASLAEELRKIADQLKPPGEGGS